MGFFSRIGNKIANGLSSASRIGLVQNVSDLAGSGEKLLGDAEDIVRRGAKAIQTGDVQSAAEVLRRGKNLVGNTKDTLQRAKVVQRDAVKIATRTP